MIIYYLLFILHTTKTVPKYNLLKFKMLKNLTIINMCENAHKLCVFAHITMVGLSEGFVIRNCPSRIINSHRYTKSVRIRRCVVLVDDLL